MRAFDAAGSSSIANGALRDLAEELNNLYAACTGEWALSHGEIQEALFRLANKAKAAAELDDALPMQKIKELLREPSASPPPTVPAAPVSGEQLARKKSA